MASPPAALGIIRKGEFSINVKAVELSKIDDLEQWPKTLGKLDLTDKKLIFDTAEPLWLKRMLNTEQLLLHPDIASELKHNGYQATALHRKMIWASVLVSLSEKDSREKFPSIKRKIIKKHGNEWWLDVQERVGKTYTVKNKLNSSRNSTSPAIALFASRSIVVAGAVNSERTQILRLIPKI